MTFDAFFQNKFLSPLITLNHSRYGLRRTDRITDENLIGQHATHFEIRDIDECSKSASDDCGSHARCINTPGNFQCVCWSNYDDVSNMTMLPPGRSCILNPDKPVDYVDDFDLGDTDDTVPEEAAIILPGRPLKERFYGPKMWLKKYKVSDGSLYAKSRPMVSYQV